MDGDSPKQGEPGNVLPSVASLLLCVHDCPQRLNYRLLTLKTEKFKLWLKNALVAFLFYRDKNGKAEEGLRVGVSNRQTARGAMTGESRW